MIANTIVNESDRRMFFITPLGVSIMGNTKVYNTYSDLIHETNPPSFAWVLDASEDPTVSVGAAFYVNKSSHWQKLYESEAMDNENFGRPEGYDELVQTVDDLIIRIESLANNQDLEEHIRNNLVHISEEEREYWNKKLDPVEGKGLSTEDYTSEEKAKLSQLENYDDTVLKAQLDSLAANKAENSIVFDIQNRMGILETETNSALNDQHIQIQNIDATAASAKEKANDAMQTVSEASETIEQHSNQLTELSHSVNTVIGASETNASNISRLEGSVQENTQDIDDLKTWKDNLVPSKDYDEEISELKAADASTNRVVDNLSTKHDNDVVALRTSIDSNTAAIGRLEQELLGVTSTLSDIEGMV